jgi:hypothetical protein
LPETYKDGADYTVISTPVNRLERDFYKIFENFLFRFTYWLNDNPKFQSTVSPERLLIVPEGTR